MCALLLLHGRISAAATENGHPLEPPDTSSPRATLKTFVDEVSTAYAYYLDKDARYRGHARAALRCLDLTDVAPALRETQGVDALQLLKEIIDRIEIPVYQQIPDAAAVDAGDMREWRVPHTEITIARVDEGPQRGEWLFTAETIRQLEDFYLRVRDLPFKPGGVGAGWEEAGLGGTFLLPREFIAALPRWAQADVAGQRVWQWIGLTLVALVGFLGVVLAHVLVRGGVSGDAPASPRSWFGELLLPSSLMAASLWVDWAVRAQLRLAGTPFWATRLIMTVVWYAGAVWVLMLVLNRLADFVISASRLRPRGIDSQLVRLAFRTFTLVIVVALLVKAAGAVGLPVNAVLAGLGVSGIAVALAAQNTIENFIGGLALFADQPVRIGDFCRFGDTVGTVEEIGLRSARVRTLDRTVITIPNGEFSRLQLENFTRRDQILLKTIVRLRYETTPDQLRLVLDRLRKLLLDHPRIADDPARVRLVGFGECSLDLEIHAYARTIDWSDFLGIRQDVLLRIMDVVSEAGTALAVPVQTNYLARGTIAARDDAAPAAGH